MKTQGRHVVLRQRKENNGRLLLFTDVITLNIKSTPHRKIKDVDAKHNFLVTGLEKLRSVICHTVNLFYLAVSWFSHPHTGVQECCQDTLITELSSTL